MQRISFLRFLFALAILLEPGIAVGESPEPSSAEQSSKKELAQGHFARGIEFFRAQRYKDAIDAFQRAHELYPSAAISFNIARAYEGLADAPAALRFYREYLRRDPGASDAAQITERVERLEDQLRLAGVQQVTIASSPSGATVSVDGRTVGITPWTGELHPGNHRLELQHPRFVSRKERFNLSLHRSLDLDFELEEKLEPPPPRAQDAPRPAANDAHLAAAPSRPGSFVEYLPWLSLGAAGAAFAGAGYFELTSARAEDDARSASTQAEALGQIHDMQSAQTTARVLLGVGSALAVTGGVLFWVTSRESAEPGELALYCQLARCTMQGEF